MAPRLFPAILCSAAAIALGGAAWVDPAPSPPQTVAAVPAAAQGSGAPPAQQAALEVTRWALAGGRLRMTFQGNAAAVDRLRQAGAISVEVHWVREAGGPGAPNLVTPLSVGRPGLAPVFASQVRRRGYFKWHSWAAKSALSPGRWSVSLTYPDGRPVQCQEQQGPCRLSFDAG